MPMAVPGDPLENELVLARLAASIAARKKASPWKKGKRDPVKRAAYDRMVYATDPVARAKKRLRVIKRDYRRYQWAIKWELALPGYIARARAETVDAGHAEG